LLLRKSVKAKSEYGLVMNMPKETPAVRRQIDIVEQDEYNSNESVSENEHQSFNDTNENSNVSDYETHSEEINEQM
jgi:hypothetical protein